TPRTQRGRRRRARPRRSPPPARPVRPPRAGHGNRRACPGRRGARHVPVDVSASLDAPYPAAAVFPWVAELDRYPAWLDIVRSVVPDGEGAWVVDLRARLGPFSRSKRLRMERTQLVTDRHARFERNELD